MRRRLRSGDSGILLLLATVSFGISLQFAFGAPPLWGQDERAHVAYAVELLHGGLPTIDTPVIDDARRYPQLADSLAAQHGPRRDIWTANHPPLYYLMSAPLVAIADQFGVPGAGLLAMRLMNSIATAITVVLIGVVTRELVPRRRAAAILAATLAASASTVAYLGGFSYNDGPTVAAITATLLCGIRMLRRGPTVRLMFAAAGLGSSAALLRAPGVLAVAACTLMALAAVLLHRTAGRMLAAATTAILVGGVPAAAAAWFYLRNLRLYGDLTAADALLRKFQRTPTGSRTDVLTDPIRYLRLFDGLWVRQVPEDGYLAALPSVLLAGAFVGLVITLAGWLRRRSGVVIGSFGARTARRGIAIAWWVLAGYGLLSFWLVLGFHSNGGSLHERYLVPLMVLLMPTLAVGLLRLAALVPAADPQLRDGIATLIVGEAMLLLGLVAQRTSMQIVHSMPPAGRIASPTLGSPAPQLALALAALAAAAAVIWQAKWLLRRAAPRPATQAAPSADHPGSERLPSDPIVGDVDAVRRRLAELADQHSLQALPSLRTVASWAEEYTRTAVRKARAEGRSWSDIGIQLGMSKQTAHQRYGATDLGNIEDDITDISRSITRTPQQHGDAVGPATRVDGP